MKLFSGPTRGRKAIASAVVIAIAAGIPVTIAVLHHGFPVTDVDLQSKDVWVTNGAKQLAGRLNRQIEELDGSTQATSSSIDIVQNGSNVFLENRGKHTLERIDQAYTTLGQRADIPKGAEISLGARTLAIVDPDDGALWTVDVSNQLSFDPRTQKPDVELGSGGHATVTAEGVVKATSPSRHRLYTLDRPGALPSSQAMDIPTDNQVSAVGETAVVLDPKGSKLLVAGGPTVDLGAPGLRLQQAGAANSFAVVAGRDGVLEVPLGGGTPTRIAARIPDSAKGNGGVSPVFLDGCVHAAWADAQRYLLACAGQKPVTATIEQQTAGDELSFRVNRHVIALNNLDTGNVWLLSDKLRLVDNWDETTPPKEQQSQETSKQKSSVQSFEDTLVKRTQQNHPPTANPDAFGVRPGRTTVLSVLDNDTDPDGDVLVITNFTPIPAEIGRLDPIDGGRALQFTPGSAAAGSTSFRYTVSDGRPGGTAETTADVRVVPNDQNSAPVPLPKANAAVSVESGQSITYNVTRDFIDPDGDDIFLAGAAPTSADQVRWSPDGTITFQHTSGEVGEKEIKVTVSDGRATAQGTVKIEVKPAGSLNPVGTPDFAKGFTGDTVQVNPLQNDLSPSGQQLRLLGVKDAPGNATVQANTDKGTIAVSAQSPGAVYFEYSLGAGSATSIGIVRVDFAQPPEQVQPPVAVKDTAFLRQGQTTEVRVLDNDVSPSGSVLAVQSVDTSAAQDSLKIEVLNNTVIRISSSAPLSAQSQFTYTVSDGRGSAVAGVTVVPVPPVVDRQPPVAVDDHATVRAGDFATVHVLDNDYHPDQEALILDPVLPESRGITGGGIIFASGDVIRFQAPQQAGEYTATYRVHDQFGESATATVSFSVTPKDPKSDRPPAPLPQTARTFAGSKVRIDIPLDGIDPDGDSVTLVDYTVAPTLGRIVESASDHFTYEAYQNSKGTDRFRYAVQDTLGKTAVGEVQIGVIPRPKESSPPNAVDDNVEVKPGRTIALQPLLNDSDPNGLPIKLSRKLLEVDTHLVAKTEGDRVVVRAPKREQTYSIRYRITNKAGASADAFILVRVTRDAPTLYPSAQDYFIQADQLKKRSSYTVDVGSLIFNPNGEDRDLKVSVEGPNQKLGSVAGQKVTVQAQDARVAVAYRVTDPADPTLTATAFIIVPPRVDGDYFPAPYLDPKLPVPQVVPMNDEKTWDLKDILVVPSGRPPILTDVNLVSANGSDGSKLWVDDNTIRFAGAKGFRGQTAIVFQVTDGDSKDDPTGRTALITLPLTVGNPDQSDVPPSFTTMTVPIEAGESAKTIDLRAATSHPNRSVIGQFQYGGAKGFTDRIKGGLSGSSLNVSAIQGAPVGTKTDITFEITYRSFTVPGTVHVVTVPSTRPRAQANTDEVKAQRSKSTTVNVLQNDYNPFADQKPLRVTAATVDNGAASAAQVTHTENGAVTVRPGSAFIGIVSVTYTIRDATDDPSRDVQGRLLVNVRDVPDQMQAPGTTDGDKQVTVSWKTPATNGEPILSYHVRGGPNEVTVGPSSSSAVVSGLTNGREYRFTVTAENVLGESNSSPSSAAAIPYGRPFAPPTPTIRQSGDGNGTMTLSWGDANGNGRPIDGYHWSLNDGQQGDVGSGTKSVTVRGHVGTTYSFTVTAHALGGTSDASRSSSVIPEPDGPPTVKATGSANGSGNVAISWAGGRSTEPIRYDVTVNGDLWRNNVAAGSATYNGAAEGKYTVRVTATSAGRNVPGSATDTAVNSKPDPSGEIVAKSANSSTCNQGGVCRAAIFVLNNMPSGTYTVTLGGSSAVGDNGPDSMQLQDGKFSTGGRYGQMVPSDDIQVRIRGKVDLTLHISGAKWNSLRTE